MIIKRWVPEREQDLLFEHTRRSREERVVVDTTTELRREHGKLKLIQKKEPNRKRSPSRSWMFT